MKILSWNVWGIGNPRAFRSLSDLLRDRHPEFIFLSETKCGEESTDSIRRCGNYYGCFTVKSFCAKGGLCLLWKEEVDLRETSYSQNHIDSVISWEGKQWRFTGLYGFSEGDKKWLT